MSNSQPRVGSLTISESNSVNLVSITATMANNLPPIRACIFDLDGLLINSEDITTGYLNELLERYNRPPITWAIRAHQMGVVDATSDDVFHQWAKLPITPAEFHVELQLIKNQRFTNSVPLAGAEKLVSKLSKATNRTGEKLQLGLASSTKRETYGYKTTRPEVKAMVDHFSKATTVLGDDMRVKKGRGKPAPDVYLVALEAINAAVMPQHHGNLEILPSECLVFEDSVAGVEAGRRAGMRVVWVPHPEIWEVYKEKQDAVLAGRLKANAGDEGANIENGKEWAERLISLEEFDHKKYGIRFEEGSI